MSPATGSWPVGAPSSGSSRGSDAVFSTLLWSRKREGQRELRAEIACRGVVEQPPGELGVAERDPNRRAVRGAGVLLSGGRTRRRGRSPRIGGAGGLLGVLVGAATGRDGYGGEQCDGGRMASKWGAGASSGERAHGGSGPSRRHGSAGGVAAVDGKCDADYEAGAGAA